MAKIQFNVILDLVAATESGPAQVELKDNDNRMGGRQLEITGNLPGCLNLLKALKDQIELVEGELERSQHG